LLSIKRLIAAELDSRSHESPRPSTMSDTKHQTVSLGLNAATSSSLASAWMRNLIRGRVSAGLQSALVGETAAAPGGDGGECAADRSLDSSRHRTREPLAGRWL
jgi:hypothetical protein